MKIPINSRLIESVLVYPVRGILCSGQPTARVLCGRVSKMSHNAVTLHYKTTFTESSDFRIYRCLCLRRKDVV